MNSCFALFGSFAAAWLCCSASGAEDRTKDRGELFILQRGPEHKILESLTGTFEARIKLYNDPKGPPAESTGVMTRTMILDGNFLQENFKGKLLGKEFLGMGVIGYDVQKKKFVSAWFDSLSTSAPAALMLGTYDADKKIFTTLGEDVDAAGRKMKARDVLRIVSADEQFFEMYRQLDGVEMKIMEITYVRKK